MSSVWRRVSVSLRHAGGFFQFPAGLTSRLLPPPSTLVFLCVVLFRLSSHSTSPAKAEEWELIKWEWKTTTTTPASDCVLLSSFCIFILSLFTTCLINSPRKTLLLERMLIRICKYRAGEWKMFLNFSVHLHSIFLLSYFSFSPFSIVINI